MHTLSYCIALCQRATMSHLKSNTIYPFGTVSPEVEEKWTAYYTNVLNSIMENGKFVPPYKHNRVTRVVQIINCALCSVTCCLPCCVCDLTNGCCYLACKCHIPNPCDGCYARAWESAMDTVYERTDQKDINTFRKNTLGIPKPAIKDMCQDYLAKFDECVAARTVPMAKRANAIRVQLVHIISTYLVSHWMMKDTNDIDALRKIVASIC